MANNGAIYGDKCYPSQTDALNAYYSQIAPSQAPGITSFVNEFVQVSGVWHLRQSSIDSSGTWTTRSTTPAPVIAFPACDPVEGFVDGVAVGWGIAAALIASASLVLIKRATS